MAGTICVINTLIFVLLSSEVHAFFNSDGSLTGNTSPRDCAWLPWKYAGCAKIRNGVYRKRQTREKVQALNGGRQCPRGDSQRITTQVCSEMEMTANLIFKSIGGELRNRDFPGAVSANSPMGTSNFRLYSQPVQSVRCSAREFTAHTGMVLKGKTCRPTRVKRQNPFTGPVESIENRDILFLIDGSGSIGEADFNQELEFVKVLAGKFCGDRRIGQRSTHVALSIFASETSHPIHFTDFYRFEDFRGAVDNVRYPSGTTCLVSALDSAYNDVFTADGGSRVNYDRTSLDADGVIVLVTDGCFNCYNGNYTEKLKDMQERLHAKKTFIIAFLIDVGIDCEQHFRNLDNGSACYQGISLASWQKFKEMTEAMKNSDDCIDRWLVNEDQC